MAQGLAHASNMENISKAIQHVFSENLDRFVPEPSQKYFQAKIIIAIRRFKNVVRWKEFWRDQKQSTKTELNELNEETEEYGFMATGLNNGLKPSFGIKNAPQRGFPTPTLRTTEQENNRNLQSPSETGKTRISLCFDKQNQVHKSN